MRAWLDTLTLLTGFSIVLSAQGPQIQISSPERDSIVSGQTWLEATVTPPQTAVGSVSFFVDGRLACTVDRAPFGCNWQAGDIVRGHHVRVVATLADGSRLIDNVRTKDLGFTERVRTEAVLVPVIVTNSGQFVRGLKRQDFEVYEDGVAQRIASMVSEDAPLDLVLAIDISGSMERALPEVKSAVKQLLTKLRPGDAATLVGFNDTMFLLAEREKDQRTREAAVDLLTSWGGTALYDATVRALDLVSHEWGRKGVVIFSDGDDRNSLTQRESYAHSTGGRAFFPRQTRELDSIFDDIVAELANQYVLSYSSTNLKQDNSWRNIKVQVRTGKYEVRARRGYRANGPQRAGR
jgi:Ca-activated chloride channel family protein